jgi:hypothetical protein
MPSRRTATTPGHPIFALVLGCLLVACTSTVRPADAARGEVEDAAAMPDASARDLARASIADAAELADTRALAAADAEVPDQTASDAAPGRLDAGAEERAVTLDAAVTAVPCPGYKKGTHTQPDVPTATFCAAYAATCGYQAGKPGFAGLPDCHLLRQRDGWELAIAGGDRRLTTRTGRRQARLPVHRASKPKLLDHRSG